MNRVVISPRFKQEMHSNVFRSVRSNKIQYPYNETCSDFMIVELSPVIFVIRAILVYIDNKINT